MATRGAQATSYDPEVALEFFKSAGRLEDFGKGETIFGEEEKAIPLLKRSRMYLLLKGEVGLVARQKPIGAVKAGEIFGEISALSGAPRSAAAVAKSDCQVLSLDDQKFMAALRKKPAFALMLMSFLIGRLRATIAQLTAAGALTEESASKEAIAFDRQRLMELLRGLSDEQQVHYREGATIVQTGQTGTRMYVVLEGRVAISIGKRVVERLGPGGVFGEAALLEPSPRLATATAETDCELLPVTRRGFLALVKLNPGFADAILTSIAERLRFLTSGMK